jgi:hypothetical protein
MIIPFLCVWTVPRMRSTSTSGRFDFEEEHRMAMPGGKIGHASLVLRDGEGLPVR